MNLDYYRGKKVFLTGHTGFKGSWMSMVLLMAGADVTGYSLEPPTDPSLFALTGLSADLRHIEGDIRDFSRLDGALKEADPDIVFHMAAQPIVRESYRIPRETYEINVMGTVNLLESVRHLANTASVVNVTTDKVYLNLEQNRGYTEDDPLDGYDPYSNSKSCSDLVTHSYRNSFFRERGPAVSTARAGNVIGGGDFAKDRIVPDCVRSAISGSPIILRNPSSVRPYQHVLEPLAAYLLLAEKQAEQRELEGAYNVGPELADAITTEKLADLFIRAWGDGLRKEVRSDGGPHEANLLMLDSTKIKERIGWKARWGIEEAICKTVEWSKVYASGGSLREMTERQITEYFRMT